MEWNRIAHNKAFVYRIFHLMKKVIILHQRHLIDVSFLLNIRVVSLRSGYTFTLISKDLHACLHGFAVENGHKCRVECLFKQRFSCLAVDDFATVER